MCCFGFVGKRFKQNMVVTFEATSVAVNKGRQSKVSSFKQLPPVLVELDVVKQEQITYI